ncbi:4-hydroxy-tetrahydrodipicolinate synthase [Tsukamurella tyrosinosolvens]|uniref:4-hydroxy-tetrahydrodipicolinate synthase n=1 Tax=Tsukamurella tyrosinosolvens TaxID=57704 RepID=UPI0007987E37|nr:4-hydroxy-tetrahydrodipicolinate synthase [Tsukamurella tyrosinosolvens]KXP06023.1 4-hydroxy-tetrahydrodipicolinate synthase [Tsukamurella tyrosinosolvens]KZL95855.1 4-hydroxy-tetrahydrodipicolinate synthase [Tsukamurella tyrosinosolvens]MCA4993337.1 4-hydroxy-tetrahydrodipicolinate synthase [Tsukamurella tyrosinosolvens]WEL95114.1 4-hydroxy-tetrahydrodipicolinate synthase [Tsukamurella tyrosinosolvens]
MQLTGLHVPLVTPFAADGTVDLASLERLAHDTLADGADGLVALGTTGEPATLTPAERAAVIDRIGGVCAEHRAVFTVGAGSNATADTAASLGGIDPRADFALVVVPYYTRPSEAGVVEHYRRIAAASPVPLIVYDIPQRTGRTLSLDTLLDLAAIDGVGGFKHAAGAVTETTVRLLAAINTSTPGAVSVLAGDDPFAAAVLALGGHGAISASANVAAGEFAALLAAWREHRLEEARVIGGALAGLSAALFAEPNPTVIKGVLAAQGRIATPVVRLPLLPASDGAVVAASALVRSVVAA